MNVNYYYEFFLESLNDFFKIRYKKESIYLPENILNNKIILNSFYTDKTYCLCTKKILEKLDIPYVYTEVDENPDLSSNFLQQYQIKYIKSSHFHESLEYQFEFSHKKKVSGFPNAVHKSKDGLEYILNIQNKKFPLIVGFNAYNVDMAIWERIYGNLYDQYNIILFSGNYGSFSKTPSKINAVLESEHVNKQAIALAWCSGFKVFAQFNRQYPNRFTHLYVVTGNYYNIHGGGQLSGFERSILALTTLMNGDSKMNIGKVFLYFFSQQAKNPFGIPTEVWPIISAKFTDINYFTVYLNSMMELSQYDLIEDLNCIKFPMTNIIASNDVISAMSNNELLNQTIDNCDHNMLNFATHWCLWTHASQIAKIIKS